MIILFVVINILRVVLVGEALVVPVRMPLERNASAACVLCRIGGVLRLVVNLKLIGR